jgi:malate dehydrogenase (oxaloacetate-decarboxylating)
MKRFDERVDPDTGEPYLAVLARGAELVDDPLLNKGTCFTEREREQLGLNGLLPPAVQGEQDQLLRAYGNFLQAGDDIRQYLFLNGLQDRNETLFCRLVSAHLEEMAPIIYTPTVGKACELYSHIYRRARGLYVGPGDRRGVKTLLSHAACDEPRVIVITDNEAILGIGDQGVGGMPIPIGKLALYSVGAGIHPAQCLPLDLDVGTDNAALLDDPLYLGVRGRRLRGAPYWALLDELVDAIATTFPRALVQWEDFANRNAFDVLARYRRRLLSFNDDIQGTGAVVVAGIRSALHRTGGDFRDARIVFYGAGASGAGSAMAVRSALCAAGVAVADLDAHVMCLDSKGLILDDRPGLDGAKAEIAIDSRRVSGWAQPGATAFQLADVVRHFKPTVLVGASGQGGAFSEAIVRDMLAGCPRPIALALSNPTSRAEVTPRDWIAWTNGAGVIGTGSPFAPVRFGGRTYAIGQGNNAFIFPGVGLGATAVGARWLPDEAFTAAAQALYECTDHSGGDEAAIYPRLRDLRHVSKCVAVAVGCALVARGAAPEMTDDQIERRVAGSMWEPRYLPYRAAVTIDNRQLAIGNR